MHINETIFESIKHCMCLSSECGKGKRLVEVSMVLNTHVIAVNGIMAYNSLLYRIGMPSNTASPLSLYVQIELLCFVAVFVNKYASLQIRLLLHKL